MDKDILKLDTNIFSEKVKYVSIGKLSEKMIDFIISKNPEYKNRLENNSEILFWQSRIKHIERHKMNFSSEEEFNQCVSDIPLIVQTPDYISFHPKDQSISFIKDYSGHTSVAIKIASDGCMSFRTMYPLTDTQLKNYIENGRAWKYI